MNRPPETLRHRIQRQLDAWRVEGLPTREGYVRAADRIADWKRERGIGGLWDDPPRMVTATLDDMLGHGLDLIHRWARVAGLRLYPLGLLQSAEAVVEACRRHRADFLGLTVLQFDTESDLAAIRLRLPARTRIIAGGPLFRADPDLARRAGIDTVLPNAAAFLQFVLDLPQPGSDGAR